MNTLFLLTLVTFVHGYTFPNYDNPITSSPKVIRPLTNSCAVQLIDVANTEYNTVHTQSYGGPCSKVYYIIVIYKYLIYMYIRDLGKQLF